MICPSDNGRRMVAPRTARIRLSVVAVASSCIMTGVATAADVGEDFLRGSLMPSTSNYADWSGVNFGVFMGRSNQNADFGSGSSDLIAYILRNTTIENEAHVSQWTAAGRSGTNASGYGAFLGYSYAIEPRLIVGVDATYSKFSNSPSANFTDSMGRSYQTTDNYLYSVNLNTGSQITLKDYATLRARFGYSFGQFLPYAFLGGAVGRTDTVRFASVASTAVDVSGGGRPNLALNPNPTVKTDVRTNQLAYGLVAGAGVDTMILPNVFLRAEYEFVQFTPINGIKMNLQTGRVGVGVKF